MLKDAAKAKGMVVPLDPIETGGWLGVLDNNGTTKARQYGEFLGKRFRDYSNIIWMSGNDFQSWRDDAQNGGAGASRSRKGIGSKGPQSHPDDRA